MDSSDDPRNTELAAVDDPRVAIAKDVISQVLAGRLLATHMVYISAPDGVFGTLREFLPTETPSVPDGSDLRELLLGKPCSVCARGAMFMAKLDRVNSVKTNGSWLPRARHMTTYLTEFTEDQHDLIEGAFEGRRFMEEEHLYDEYDELSDEHEKAASFHDQHGNPTDLMLAIMRNIVDNDGEFKP